MTNSDKIKIFGDIKKESFELLDFAHTRGLFQDYEYKEASTPDKTTVELEFKLQLIGEDMKTLVYKQFPLVNTFCIFEGISLDEYELFHVELIEKYLKAIQSKTKIFLSGDKTPANVAPGNSNK